MTKEIKMNTVINPYDALYTNLKNKFTVVKNGEECSVADFMMMKAGKQKATSNLPTEIRRHPIENSMNAFMSFMNEKLTVSNPPIKDKTLKRFPIRSAFSAMFSAVAVCALVISCGIFTINRNEENVVPTAQTVESEADNDNSTTSSISFNELN